MTYSRAVIFVEGDNTNPNNRTRLDQFIKGVYDQISTLPTNYTGLANKIVKVKSDETGLEVGEVPVQHVRSPIVLGTGQTIGADHVAQRLVSESGVITFYERSVILRNSGTPPASNVTVTLPGGASVTVGMWWSIMAAPDQGGTLTIQAPSGSTINGESSISLDGPNAEAIVTVGAVSGANVTYYASGQISSGQTFTGPTMFAGSVNFNKQEVYGGWMKLGPTIDNSTSSPIVLGDSDIGVERRITATTAKTIQVPTGWRGVFHALNETSSTTHVLSLEGGGSVNVGPGKKVIVDANGTKRNVAIITYDLSG
jgi:hypothetical protein